MPRPTDPELVITPRVLRDWPLPDPAASSDKTGRGTVLVVGGSRFTPGAVLLAGESAMRAGAGRLQLAVVESTAAALSITVPEAKVVGLPETKSGSVSSPSAHKWVQLEKARSIGSRMTAISLTSGSAPAIRAWLARSHR